MSAVEDIVGSDLEISIVIATHQRRDELLGTLGRLASLRLDADRTEIFVVDNASADETADAVAARFPDVRLVRLQENLGSCGKALGVDRARGRYILFLDDDSFPRTGSIERMLQAFEADPLLGAAGFIVHLANGRRECSALPGVFVGCGVGLRREALDAVGGLDAGLFMQAEEYDLAFRLVNAGWRVENLADLHVDHLKSPQARLTGRTLYHDIRNNLIVAARYLPEGVASDLREDLQQRYRWIAENQGLIDHFERGLAAGLAAWDVERSEYRHQRLSPKAFETLFRYDEIEQRMAKLVDAGVRRPIFADLGKNIGAFVHAARQCGIDPIGIADDRYFREGRAYRGIPLVSVQAAGSIEPDAIIISNCAPVHAESTARMWQDLDIAPVHCWFGTDRWHSTSAVCRLSPITAAS